MTEPNSHPPSDRQHTGPDVNHDPALSFERQELKALLEIWQEKRGSRPMPARADFSPIDLKAHLPHIMLVDVETAPTRFRYRLLGTNITSILRRDVTKRYFEEVYPSPLLEALLGAFAFVVDECAPLRIFSRRGHPGNPVFLYECLLLPLSADGATVNMVLGELLFTPLSVARQPAA